MSLFTDEEQEQLIAMALQSFEGRQQGMRWLIKVVEREVLERAAPKKEWSGLTTAERKALWNNTKKATDFAELVEAKLKERNA